MSSVRCERCGIGSKTAKTQIQNRESRNHTCGRWNVCDSLLFVSLQYIRRQERGRSSRSAFTARLIGVAKKRCHRRPFPLRHRFNRDRGREIKAVNAADKSGRDFQMPLSYFDCAALTISSTKSSTFHSLPVKTFCTRPCASTTTVRRL